MGASTCLGGLKLDEIDAANSFLMLLMARNSLKWSFKTHFRPVKNQIFEGRPSASRRPREGSPGLDPKKNCWKWSQVGFSMILNWFKMGFKLIFTLFFTWFFPWFVLYFSFLRGLHGALPTSYEKNKHFQHLSKRPMTAAERAAPVVRLQWTYV